MWFLYIYLAGIVVIYFVTALIEKNEPLALADINGDYGMLMAAIIFWPVALSVLFFVVVCIPIYLLVSWPWRKIVNPKTKFIPKDFFE